MAGRLSPANTDGESQPHAQPVPEERPRGVQEARQPPVHRPPHNLHLLVHLREENVESEEEEEEIDMHPETTLLVPSQAIYVPPPPLHRPNHTLQGLPPGPPLLTIEEMEPRFKSRVPLRLVTTTTTTTTTTNNS